MPARQLALSLKPLRTRFALPAREIGNSGCASVESRDLTAKRRVGGGIDGRGRGFGLERRDGMGREVGDVGRGALWTGKVGRAWKTRGRLGEGVCGGVTVGFRRWKSTASSRLSDDNTTTTTTTPPTKASHPHLIRVVHSAEAYASRAESLVDLPAGAHFASFADTATPASTQTYATVQVRVLSGPIDTKTSSASSRSSSSSSSPSSSSVSSSSNPSQSHLQEEEKQQHHQHINLNSDLLYANHSCTPSLVFDTGRMEARVVADRPLRAGDELTFFYPSTEWEMDRPFRCRCGAGKGKCLGWIDGAKVLARRVEPGLGSEVDGLVGGDGSGSGSGSGDEKEERRKKRSVLERYWLNEHVKEMLRREKEGSEEIERVE